MALLIYVHDNGIVAAAAADAADAAAAAAVDDR